MQIFQRELPKDFELILMGDDHDGTALRHKKGVEKTIDYVLAEKNRYIIHMGDALDAVATDDKRYDNESTTEQIPLKQAQNASKTYERAKDRIITMLLGNHELKLHRYGNLTRDIICDSLGVPYGTWSCKVHFQNKGKTMFKGYFIHGTRGALNSNAKDSIQREANMKATLKMKLQEKVGDCVLMACGHFHKLIVVDPIGKLFLTDSGGKIKQNYLAAKHTDNYIDPDQRYYICTGSYLKNQEIGISGYAEVAGYNPTELGAIIVTVKNGLIEGARKMIV